MPTAVGFTLAPEFESDRGKPVELKSFAERPVVTKTAGCYPSEVSPPDEFQLKYAKSSFAN
jgi:hypothetical protein